MEAIIAPVQLGVPIQALIQHAREGLGERKAQSNAATTEGHAMAEVRVGWVALWRSSDVDHLPPVILGQHRHQIVGAHNGVVVAQEEPPGVAVEAEAEGLRHNPGDAEPRGVTRRIGVAEAGDVLGDTDRRKGGGSSDGKSSRV